MGFISLVDAYNNNVVPQNTPLTEESFDGVEDPSTIIGSPRDVFERAQYNHTVANYSPKSENKEVE